MGRMDGARAWRVLPVWIVLVLAGGLVGAALRSIGETDDLVVSESTFAAIDGVIGDRAPDSDERRRAENFLDQMLDLGVAGASEDLSASQLACIGEGIDVTPAEVTAVLGDASYAGLAEWERLVDQMLVCVPDLSAVDSFVSAFARSFTAQLGAGAEISDDESRCMLNDLVTTSDDVGRALIRPESDDVALLLAAAERCFDDSDLAVLRGDAGAGPQRVGDDAGLDAVHGECVAGNETACELLIHVSSEGSEYFETGRTCAGRGDGSSPCVPDLIVTENGGIDQSSPGLTPLADRCVAGDMLACDLVYWISDIGGALEHLGHTCGERIAAAVPDCRTRFADLAA